MKPVAPCRVVPVPRTLSSSCGYAAEAEMEVASLAMLLREDDTIEWEAVYRQDAGGGFTQVLQYE